MIQERLSQITFFSKEDEDSKPEKKVPKGFEKFLKKTREGSQKSNDEKSKKEAAQKKQEDDDDETDLEEEPIDEKKSKDDKSENAKKKLNEFFFEPNGKGPKWENVGLVALLGGAFAYYLATMGSPSEEITYIDFINKYLAQGQCTMITISEDKSSDMFKFRAQIDTIDGKKVHLVLPQVENFLYKLDLAQREMGKSPNDFVPVKYANEATAGENKTLNYLIGASFILLLIQLYRSKHTGGKGGSSS